MKVIIAGSRWLQDPWYVEEAIKKSGFEITEAVSGTARGIDYVGEIWAEKHGIPIKQFSPDWDKYGKSAGPKRNGEMARYADALIAIPGNPPGPGTANMISQMKLLNKPVYVYQVEKRINQERRAI